MAALRAKLRLAEQEELMPAVPMETTPSFAESVERKAAEKRVLAERDDLARELSTAKRMQAEEAERRIRAEEDRKELEAKLRKQQKEP